jgi:hypothetical protein
MEKRINNYFLYTIFILCLIGSFVACSSSTDSFRPYVSKKAPKYSQKLDTVIVRTGKDRAIFKIPKPIDPTVKEVGLFWNSGTDSLRKDFSAKDTLTIEIDTLKGGQSYSFNIYTLDNNGNKSLKLNRLIRIYGSQYTNSLLNRAIKRAVLKSNGTLNIDWGSAGKQITGTKIIIYNHQQKEDSLFVPPDSSVTLLTNLNTNNDLSFRYQTFYRPNSSEIDIFHTDLEHLTYQLQLNKSLWSNAKLPTDTWQHYSHYAFDQLWDNNAETGGYSFETNKYDKFPIWFTIDLGQKAKISSFIYYNQPHWSNEMPKKFVVWGSANPNIDPDNPFNDSWHKLGTYIGKNPNNGTFDPDTPYPENGLTCIIDNADKLPAVQYIRFEVLSTYGGGDSGDGWVDIGELTLFGLPQK